MTPFAFPTVLALVSLTTSVAGRLQGLKLRLGNSPQSRELFDLPSPFEFYNKACIDSCHALDHQEPFLNACPKCPDKYTACNNCCYGGASSLKMRWHGCPGKVSLVPPDQARDDCEVDAVSEKTDARFVDCDCYDRLTSSRESDTPCDLFESISLTTSESSSSFQMCLVSVTILRGNELVSDLSSPLPSILGVEYTSFEKVNRTEATWNPNPSRTYFDTTCAYDGASMVQYPFPLFPGYGKFPGTCQAEGFIDFKAAGIFPLPEGIDHYQGSPPNEAYWFEFVDGTSPMFWPELSDGRAQHFNPMFAVCACVDCEQTTVLNRPSESVAPSTSPSAGTVVNNPGPPGSDDPSDALTSYPTAPPKIPPTWPNTSPSDTPSIGTEPTFIPTTSPSNGKGATGKGRGGRRTSAPSTETSTTPSAGLDDNTPDLLGPEAPSQPPSHNPSTALTVPPTMPPTWPTTSLNDFPSIGPEHSFISASSPSNGKGTTRAPSTAVPAPSPSNGQGGKAKGKDKGGDKGGKSKGKFKGGDKGGKSKGKAKGGKAKGEDNGGKAGKGGASNSAAPSHATSESPSCGFGVKTPGPPALEAPRTHPPSKSLAYSPTVAPTIPLTWLSSKLSASPSIGSVPTFVPTPSISCRNAGKGKGGKGNTRAPSHAVTAPSPSNTKGGKAKGKDEEENTTALSDVTTATPSGGSDLNHPVPLVPDAPRTNPPSQFTTDSPTVASTMPPTSPNSKPSQSPSMGPELTFVPATSPSNAMGRKGKGKGEGVNNPRPPDSNGCKGDSTGGCNLFAGIHCRTKDIKGIPDGALCSFDNLCHNRRKLAINEAIDDRQKAHLATASNLFLDSQSGDESNKVEWISTQMNYHLGVVAEAEVASLLVA
jgi:hypothetical protein